MFARSEADWPSSSESIAVDVARVGSVVVAADWLVVGSSVSCSVLRVVDALGCGVHAGLPGAARRSKNGSASSDSEGVVVGVVVGAGEEDNRGGGGSWGGPPRSAFSPASGARDGA